MLLLVLTVIYMLYTYTYTHTCIALVLYFMLFYNCFTNQKQIKKLIDGLRGKKATKRNRKRLSSDIDDRNEQTKTDDVEKEEGGQDVNNMRFAFAGVQGAYAAGSDGLGSAVAGIHAVPADDAAAGVRALVLPRAA